MMHALEKLAQARAIARKKTPYYRTALLSLIPVETPGIGTLACTDRYILMYDPTAVEKWPIDGLAGIMVHEVSHLLRKHHKRGASLCAGCWNIGADLAINENVIAMRYKLPAECVMPHMFGYPSGLTAEQYWALHHAAHEKQQEKEKQQQKKDPGQEGQGQGQEGQGQGRGQEGQGQGQGQEGQGQGQEGQGQGQGQGQASDTRPSANPACGSCGSCAGNPANGEPEFPESAGRSDAAVERIARQTAQAVKDHVAAKGIGSVPGSIQSWADVKLGIEKVKWQAILAKKIRQASQFRSGANVQSYAWPNRRQASVGFGPGKPIMAGCRSPLPRIAVAIDTSGSMSDKDLGDAIIETRGVLKSLHAEVEIIAADAVVQKMAKVSDWKQIAKNLIGRGGTNFCPVFEEIAKRPAMKKPQILIYMTDGGGYGPAEPPPGIRVIWVLIGQHAMIPMTGNSAQINWGEIVEAK